MAKGHRIFTAEEKEVLAKIGKNISKKRKKKPYTQVHLAALVNMEKPHISAIENGHQNVSSLTLKKLADALECKVEDFFKGV